MKKKVYVIPNSHMDPIWIWRLREGRAAWLNTCRTTVKMLKKYPFLKFSRSSSVCYRWIEESDPALFREIRKLVEAGRWEPVGGWVEQSDVIITPGESLIRQAEHGKPVCEIVLDGPIAHDAIVSAKKLAPDKTWIEYVDYVGKESERRRLAMQGGTPFLKPDHIAFPTECGIGTVVTGCEISNNRHNGITLQSGNALIENNKIGGNTDFGILITSYYRGLGGWREGGLPYNVVIRRNTIHDTFIALSLWYSTGIGKYSPLIAFRDILFEENICKNIVRGIDIYNVNGLCLRRNVFDGVNMARSDVSRNVYCENNLWNGERFSPLHFTKTAQDSSVYAFRTTDPKFEGKSPTVNQRNLSHYEWSNEKDCVKVALRKEGLAVEVLKQPADDKIHPAFTQVGYLFPGLWEGTYQLTCKVVSSHDVQILAISEIVHKKKFAEQKLDLKANEPQEIKLVINIDKASALQATRLIYFCIAQAPAGTKFEFGLPSVELAAKE